LTVVKKYEGVETTELTLGYTGPLRAHGILPSFWKKRVKIGRQRFRIDTPTNARALLGAEKVNHTGPDGMPFVQVRADGMRWAGNATIVYAQNDR